MASYFCEYIGGNNTIVNTGIIPTTNTKVQAKAVYSKYGGVSFLGYFNSGDDGGDWRLFRANSVTYFDSGSNGNRINGTYFNSTTTAFEFEFGNNYLKDIPTNTDILCGQKYTLTSQWKTPIKIFTNTDYGKIYYCKIYQGDILVRDFVPAVKDDVPCMWDKVGKQYYYPENPSYITEVGPKTEDFNAIFCFETAEGKNDGSTWEDAYSGKDAIQHAWENAHEGDTIYVAYGTYNPIKNTATDYNVTIESLQGPSYTIIDAKKKDGVRLVEGKTEKTGLTIKGFTLKNAHKKLGGQSWGAVRNIKEIYNCIITECSMEAISPNAIAVVGVDNIERCAIKNIVDSLSTKDAVSVYKFGTIKSSLILDLPIHSGGNGIYNSTIDGIKKWSEDAGTPVYNTIVLNDADNQSTFQYCAGPNVSANSTLHNINTQIEQMKFDGADNYHISVDSLCREMGSSAYTPQGGDLDGEEYRNPPSIGCFEIPYKAKTIYCDANLKTGNNDGTSWENAFQGTSAIISACEVYGDGYTIMVNDGTYYPFSPSSDTYTLTIKSKNGADKTFITTDDEDTYMVFRNTNPATSAIPEKSLEGFSICGLHGTTATSSVLSYVQLHGCKVYDNSTAKATNMFNRIRCYDCLLHDNVTTETQYGRFLLQCAFNNSTVINNTAKTFGVTVGIANFKSYNSIFKYNKTQTGETLGWGQAFFTNAYNCCSDVSGSVTALGTNISADPQLISNYHITPKSVCFMAGNASYLTAEKDLEGNYYNATPSIGCYDCYIPMETKGTVYYCDANLNTGLNNGTSWENAFQGTSALKTAFAKNTHCTIFAASGTYAPIYRENGYRTTLYGCADVSACIIDGGAVWSDNADTFVSNPATLSVTKTGANCLFGQSCYISAFNFTLQNGYSTSDYGGAGARNVYINNCHVKHCLATVAGSAKGGGICGTSAINCTIEDCRAVEGGGANRSYIDNCKILNCRAGRSDTSYVGYGGGVMNYYGYSLANTLISGCKALTQGGATRLDNSTALNCEMVNCDCRGVACGIANYGGVITNCKIHDINPSLSDTGIIVYSANIYDSEIYNCISKRNAVVCGNTGRTLSAYNTIVHDCSAGLAENGVSVNGGGFGYFNVKNCSAINDVACGRGGGMVTCIVHDSVISGCTALGYGNAGYTARGGAMQGCSAYNTSAINCVVPSSWNGVEISGGGGGVANGYYENCLIQGCSSYQGYYGGMNSCSGVNCRIIGNWNGLSYGAGVGDCQLTGCLISGNWAGGSPGANNSIGAAWMRCSGYNCTIIDNYSVGVAGALREGAMYGCYLSGNHSDSSAAGAEQYVFYGGSFYNCIIENHNAASGSLGGSYINSICRNNYTRYNLVHNQPTKGSLFYNNTVMGDTLFCRSTHVNDTVVYNNIQNSIFYQWGGHNGTLANCCFYGNTRMKEGKFGIYPGSAGYVVNNYFPSGSIVFDVGTISGNISGFNPGFEDASNYKFNLTSYSPLIGMGTTSVSASLYPSADMGGHAYKPTPAIGAYEYYSVKHCLPNAVRPFGGTEKDVSDKMVQVDYLESNGLQYINTECVPTPQTKVEVKAQMLGNNNTSWASLLGAMKSDNSLYGVDIRYNASSTTSLNFLFFNSSYSGRNINHAYGKMIYATLSRGKVTCDDLDYTVTTTGSSPGYPIYLFGENNDGVFRRGSISRIYSVKIWNGNELIRNFVPVSVGGIGYMYDMVSNKLFGSSGVGNLIVGPKKNFNIVPIEYLETTGTQYIPIGSLGSTYKSVLDCQFTRIDASQINGGGTNKTGAYYACDFAGVYNSLFFIRACSPNVVTMNADTNRHTFVMDCPNHTTSIDNTTYNVASYTGDIQNTSFLGARHDVDTKAFYCYEKIYSFKLYNSGVLVMDLIPVRIGNVGYFLDRISGELHENHGTGDFILGPDKQSEDIMVPIEYLESDGGQYINTGVSPTSNFGIDASITLLEDMSTVGKYAFLFGSRDAVGNRGATNYSAVWYNKNSSECGVRADWANSSTNDLYINFPISAMDMEFHVHGSTFICNDKSVVIAQSKSDSSYPFCLFGTNTASSITASKQRIKSFTLFNGSTATMDLIPVRIDSVGYMYDKISGRLLGNAGSGNFILGPDKT